MYYPHPACRATRHRHPRLAFLATLGISYETVVLYRRRWLLPAFERRVTSATKLLCGTAEGDHVLLLSDVCSQSSGCISNGASPAAQHMSAMFGLWRRVASATSLLTIALISPS